LSEETNHARTLLDEQIRYYRARASEYDATSIPPDGPVAASLRRVEAEVAALGIRGRVLELAAGTGQWTERLVASASELTAVDASPEMLRINAEKVGDRRVRYVVSDVFDLVPEPTWDVVFFSAWLSHVPATHFDAFWDLVAGLLAPGGRAIVVDEAAPGLGGEDWVDDHGGVVRRRLSDGSDYRAVKILWEPAELEQRLRSMGWEAEIHGIGVFLWGWASPPATARTR
jgi:demethylmenaquinone methyltransferase/2-methoxy-6-polyprenyl-1,4-benzoquinol methylase